jgi:hypothetical protein
VAQFRTDQHKLDFSNNKTRYEVMMLDDRISPSGTMTDAFGRLRISSPFTIFDSNHRFADNGLWATSNTAGGTYAFITNQSTVGLSVTAASGAEVIRESKRVFSYQPGKSLLVMNTFVMNTPQTNLRQRVGYFGAQNGVYLENDGVTNYFVLRSYISGSIVEQRIAQADWNRDKFDGTGYSAQTGGSDHTGGIRVDRSNILWFDIEWLGVGDVRCGFVVDGKMVIAHVFHNDNVNLTPYMTTASLPIRYEITNTGATAELSMLKQICSTVISEGGYELRGTQISIGTDIVTPKTLGAAGATYSMVSIRLKSTRLNAVVIPSAASVLPVSTGKFMWKLIQNGVTSGGSWVSAGNDSAVEYNLTGTSVTGGRVVASGLLTTTNQSTINVDILRASLLKFQLERDSLAGTPEEFIIAMSSDGSGDTAYATLDWEEVTR